MDYSTFGYDPVRSSELERTADKAQLPSFNHLLYSLDQSSNFRDSSSSLNTRSGSNASLDDAYNDRDESEGKTVDNGPASSVESRGFSPPAVLDAKSSRLCQSLASRTQRAIQRKYSGTDSQPAYSGSRQIAHGDHRVYRITRSSYLRNGLPIPRGIASRLTSSQPNPRRSAISHVRSRSVYNVSDKSTVLIGSYCKTKSLDSLRGGQSTSAKSYSSDTNPVHLRLSIPSLLSSLSSSSPTREHFHGVPGAPMAVSDAASPLVPNRVRPMSRGDSSSTSRSVRPSKEDTRAKVPATESAENFESGTDPAEIDVRLTQHYLTAFFDHTDIAVPVVLPRSQFMTWALDFPGKSMVDRVMLYALMSWSSFRCSRSDSADRRAVFKAIVYRELEVLNSERCLQSVHALLFLAFTEYGDHQFQAGLDAFTMCVDVMSFLKLDVEQVCREDMRAYGLSANVDAECRRRTFWAAFCFDDHLQLKGLSLEVTNRSDIAIESPCEIEPYHCEWLRRQSCFESDGSLGIPSTARESNTTCITAQMIWITRIHADIVSNMSRVEAGLLSPNRFPDDQVIRAHFYVRLKAWSDAYSNPVLEQPPTHDPDYREG